MKTYVLFNPLAGSGKCANEVKKVSGLMPGRDIEYIDMTAIASYAGFFAGLAAEDEVVIAGGDGTLNRFINDTDGFDIKNPLYYTPCGSGNDFYHDLTVSGCTENPVRIEKYIKDLPYVTVNGKTSRFLNNVGFGVDGYCSEVGDEMRAAHVENINYTSIAIKGVLFHFKPSNAKVTVDGVTKSYKKCWICPTMHGRFYGGGMMPTPDQDRLDPEGYVSVMSYYGVGNLKALIVFPGIFKGTHVKHKEMIEIVKGKNIKVEFDKPTALQIDGETVKGVTSYEVKTAK